MSEKKEIQVKGKEELEEQGTRSGRYFKPAVDIFETEDSLHLLADVPGAEVEDFDIEVHDNKLTLTGPTQPVEDKWEPVYNEYGIGHYMRQFRLGKQIDQSKITAKAEDGVLELTLPKVEQAKPKKIEIK